MIDVRKLCLQSSSHKPLSSLADRLVLTFTPCYQVNLYPEKPKSIIPLSITQLAKLCKAPTPELLSSPPLKDTIKITHDKPRITIAHLIQARPKMPLDAGVWTCIHCCKHLILASSQFNCNMNKNLWA